MKKGFTLIELLVVIAIIGILSSVVLASLNGARAKGIDATVKSNLANARAQAEIFLDSNSNKYAVTVGATTDVCYSAAASTVGSLKGIYPNVLAAIQATQGTTGALVAENAVQTTTTASCNATADAWVAQAPLKTSGHWCVDSTGASVANASVLAANATKCP
jgi:type IV pilus assembly protein PilA